MIGHNSPPSDLPDRRVVFFAFVRDAQISAAARCLGWAIGSYMDADGQCRPGHKLLASKIGVGNKTVPALLEELYEASLVFGHSKGPRSATVYTARIDYERAIEMFCRQRRHQNSGVPRNTSSPASGVPRNTSSAQKRVQIQKTGVENLQTGVEGGQTGVPGNTGRKKDREVQEGGSPEKKPSVEIPSTNARDIIEGGFCNCPDPQRSAQNFIKDFCRWLGKAEYPSVGMIAELFTKHGSGPVVEALLETRDWCRSTNPPKVPIAAFQAKLKKATEGQYFKPYHFEPVETVDEPRVVDGTARSNAF